MPRDRRVEFAGRSWMLLLLRCWMSDRGREPALIAILCGGAAVLAYVAAEILPRRPQASAIRRTGTLLQHTIIILLQLLRPARRLATRQMPSPLDCTDSACCDWPLHPFTSHAHTRSDTDGRGTAASG